MFIVFEHEGSANARAWKRSRRNVRLNCPTLFGDRDISSVGIQKMDGYIRISRTTALQLEGSLVFVGQRQRLFQPLFDLLNAGDLKSQHLKSGTRHPRILHEP